MYAVITGKVINIKPTSITLNNNGIGYQIYTAKPFSYEINEVYTIYLYQHVRENELSLYGFNTEVEKQVFLELIKVKGLGPKITLPMFAVATVEDILGAIQNGNVDYLKRFPKIGEKLARQIILDLKGKFVLKNLTLKAEENELNQALLALGFKQTKINQISAKVDDELPLAEQLRMALRLLIK